MAINYIVAVVRESKVKSIVSKLYENDVPGVTVTPVRGYGEHANIYQQDITEDNVKVEVFIAEKYAQHVANLIMHSAHTGMDGDGVIAVMPVNDMYHIRDYSKLSENDLQLTKPSEPNPD
ncbi:MAG: P-II family nitrogen regulator [Gammaproteobacteria bacterium]|jgi:nitrogen regulatory protein P-II 1